LIDLPGQPPGAIGNVTVTPPPGASQFVFVVRRATEGASVNVPLVVADSCGDWPTFVGAGLNAWRAALSGVVRSSIDSTPVAGARVAITGIGDATTDPGGSFAFPNLPVSSYTLITTANGFQSDTRTAVVASGAGGFVAIGLTPTLPPVPASGLLPGPSGDPANAQIADLPFPDPDPADLVAPSGIPISVRDLLVEFQDTASVGQVNALLQSISAEIVGANTLGKLVLVRLLGPSNLTRVLDAQHTLLASPLVRSASINYGMEDERLPPHNTDTGNNRWTWEVPPNLSSGDWGLKAIRMPQAWNLYDRLALLDDTIEVLIMDAGPGAADADHPDLSPRVDKFRASDPEGEHATLMAGIVGAIWNNNLGVEGIYPRNITLVSRTDSYWGSLPDTVVRLLGARPQLRIVAYSAGQSKMFLRANIDPVTALVDPTKPAGPSNPTWRAQTDASAVTLLNTIQRFATGPGGRTNFLMFCSAGNARLRPGTAQDYQARDNGPCTNVAVRGAAVGAGADHFLAVESTNAAGNRASDSAASGTLSAPGVCVRATERHDDGSNYDAICVANDAAILNYATQSGTSFATPYAAGVAAYVWSLDSDLSYTQVRGLIGDATNRLTVGAGPTGGSPANEQVDAFAATLAIDAVRANKKIQRALADVDDGTSDGNTRIDPFTAAVNTSISTSDGRRGDGHLTMRDFRTWRDAYLQARAADFAAAGLAIALDGAEQHFKKDLNFDGCVGTQAATPAHPATTDVPARTDAQCSTVPGAAPGENVYPRYDFNGDGQIDQFAVTAPFKRDPDPPACAKNPAFALVAPPGCLRDVDVLADADLWETEEVDGYKEQVYVDPDTDEAGFSDSAIANWEPRRFLLKNRDGATLAPAVLKDLPDYVHSFDLHVHINWDAINPDYEKVAVRVFSEVWPNGIDDNGDGVKDEIGEETLSRVVYVPRGEQRPVVTVPLWTGRAAVVWGGADNDPPFPTPPQQATIEWADVKFGEDRSVSIP